MITNSYNKFTDIGVNGEPLALAMTSDLGHKNQGQERVPIQHLNIMDIIVRMTDHPIQTHTIVVSNSITHLHLSSGMNSVVKVIVLILKVIFFKITACRFHPIPGNECPDELNIGECHWHMQHNELCEADQELPDGYADFDNNNCGFYDMFRCIRDQ